MKIWEEKSLKDFEFWSGAKDSAALLTDEDFDQIEAEFESLYPDGMEDTQINDWFWFEFDTIAQMLGYESEEDMERKRDPYYVDDDDLENYVESWFKEFMTKLKNEHKWKEIISVYENLFYGYEEVAEEEYREKSEDPNKFTVAKYAKTAYDIIIREIPENDLMELLFEDDNGEYQTDGIIPNKEKFRDEIIYKNRIEHEKDL